MTRRITWLCTQGAVTAVLVALGILAESGVISPQLKPNALTVLLGYGCANAALFIADGEERGVSRTTQATAVDAVVTHISHVPPGTEQATEAMKAGSQLLSIVVPAHTASSAPPSSLALPAGTVTVEQPAVPSTVPPVTSSPPDWPPSPPVSTSIVSDTLPIHSYDSISPNSHSSDHSRPVAVRPSCRQKPTDPISQATVSNGNGVAPPAEPSPSVHLS